MKKHLMLVILALIAALLLVTGLVAAKAMVVEFTGTLTPVGFYPGTVTNPDGNIHIRGEIEEFRVDATDPRVSGTMSVVINANWNSSGVGPMRGTYRLDSVGGFWEGTWTGMRHADGSISVRNVGHGREDFEGLKVWTTIEFPSLEGDGTMSGHILDPHGE